MGRPLKDIDPKLVERLAAIQCTMIEIAAVVGCSVDTLENRFSDIIKHAKEGGKASLRRKMWRKAQEGHPAMLIFLSKQLLGYRDDPGYVPDEQNKDVPLSAGITKEEAKKLLEARRKPVSPSS